MELDQLKNSKVNSSVYPVSQTYSDSQLIYNMKLEQFLQTNCFLNTNKYQALFTNTTLGTAARNDINNCYIALWYAIKESILISVRMPPYNLVAVGE